MLPRIAVGYAGPVEDSYLIRSSGYGESRAYYLTLHGAITIYGALRALYHQLASCN